MTAGAKAVYEAILENGSLDTVRLRRKARIGTESAESRFDAHHVGRHTQTDRRSMGRSRLGQCWVACITNATGRSKKSPCYH